MKNIIGFNITWFGLVCFGNEFIPIAIMLLLIHCFFFLKNKHELLLIFTVCAIGICVDSLLQYSNIFIFEKNSFIPLWLVFLWGCFATTLSHSLQFLEKSIWFQYLAAIVAPLSYIAGHQLGAVTFGYPLVMTYCILTLIWSFLFIVFFKLKSSIVKKETSYV